MGKRCENVGCKVRVGCDVVCGWVCVGMGVYGEVWSGLRSGVQTVVKE